MGRVREPDVGSLRCLSLRFIHWQGQYRRAFTAPVIVPRSFSALVGCYRSHPHRRTWTWDFRQFHEVCPREGAAWAGAGRHPSRFSTSDGAADTMVTGGEAAGQRTIVAPRPVAARASGLWCARVGGEASTSGSSVPPLGSAGPGLHARPPFAASGSVFSISSRMGLVAAQVRLRPRLETRRSPYESACFGAQAARLQAGEGVGQGASLERARPPVARRAVGETAFRPGWPSALAAPTACARAAAALVRMGRVSTGHAPYVHAPDVAAAPGRPGFLYLWRHAT